MKLPRIILAVLGLHVGVITLFMFQAGCQSKIPNPVSADTGTEVMKVSADTHQAGLAEAANADVIDPAFNAGITSAKPAVKERRPRMQPTRPKKEWKVEAVDDTKFISAPVKASTVVNPGYKKNIKYSVSTGDSIWKIANKHGVSIQALLKANNLGENGFIHPGQELVIPLAGGYSPVKTEKRQAQVPVTAGSGTYIIQSGDTLSKIAYKNNTTVEAIQEANNMSHTRIFQGQKLILPGGSKKQNRIPASKKSARKTPIRSTNSGGFAHDVVSGDTLGAISKKYNISVKELMELNGISNPRSLRAGQRLMISRQQASSNEIVPQDATAVTIGTLKTNVSVSNEAFEDSDEIPTVSVETVKE